MQFRLGGTKQREILALVIVVLAALWRVWPLLVSPTDSVLNGDDGVLTAWIVDSVAQKVLTLDFGDFWDGRIFYPYNNLSLAFSDIYLPQALLSTPLKLFLDEPIALANLQTVFGCVLTLLSMYWLAHEVTNHRGLAVLAAFVFGYSGFYTVALGHLHSAHLWGISLSIVCLIKLSQKASRPWLGLWWVCFIAQTLTAFLTGYFVLLPAVFWLLMDKRLRMNTLKMRRTMALSAILVFGLLALVALPYLKMSRLYNAQRSIQDAAHFSLSIDDLVEKFWSFPFYLLIIIGLFVLFKKKALGQVKLITIVALVALVLSLGPVLKWKGQTVKIFNLPIPLPYAVLYYLVPGFTGIRAIERWVYPAMILLTVIGVYGISRFTRKVQLLAMVLIGLILLPEFKPLPAVWAPPRANYPQVYWWLKNQPAGVVLELPIARWGEGEATQQQIYAMLYQTLHEKTLVNGYSGFSPLDWEERVARMGNSADLLTKEISDIKPEYVLLKKDMESRVNQQLTDLGYVLAYEDDNNQVMERSN